MTDASAILSPDDVLYVRNELGAVHSVDRAHFDLYLTETSRAGNTRMKAGFEEITEEQARTANPQLFGHPDPDVIRGMTSAEIKETRERRQFEQQLRDELLAELEPKTTPKK